MIGSDGFIGLFDAAVRHDGERVFARYNGAPLSFAALARMADAVAAGLRRRGLQPGDRVAAMLRNGPAALALMFGLARAGLVWIPVNVQQRGPGLRYVLEHSAPRLVVAEADLVGALEACGADLPSLLVAGDEGEDGLERLLTERPPSATSGPRPMRASRSSIPRGPRARRRASCSRTRCSGLPAKASRWSRRRARATCSSSGSRSTTSAARS
jgi:crotonobetaine/carnitine-CoA ligase